jgi:hypothetical protein
MHKPEITSIDDYQKVATMLREDRRQDSQALIDQHNRRAGRLTWLRAAIYEGGNSNLGGKPVLEEDAMQSLINRYVRCLLAWTRSDEALSEEEIDSANIA